MPRVRDHANAIGPNWSPFPVLLAGKWYLARRIGGVDLDDINPFQLLAALPQAHAAIGDLSLLVTGKTGAGGRAGFISLAGRNAPGFSNRGGRGTAGSSFAHRRMSRKQAHRPLDYLRTLRNRIAHHEPIFTRHLWADYQSILTITGWIDPATCDWIDHHSRVADLLPQPPDLSQVRF